MYLLFTICSLSGKMYGNVHMNLLGVNSAKLCIKFASQLRMFAAYFAKNNKPFMLSGQIIQMTCVGCKCS